MKTNTLNIVLGIIFLLLGGYVVFNPEVSLVVLSLYIAISFFIASVIGFFSYFEYRNTIENSGIFFPLINLILGLILLLHPSITLTMITIIVWFSVVVLWISTIWDVFNKKDSMIAKVLHWILWILIVMFWVFVISNYPIFELSIVLMIWISFIIFWVSSLLNPFISKED